MHSLIRYIGQEQVAQIFIIHSLTSLLITIIEEFGPPVSDLG